MAVDILFDAEQGHAALFCNTTDTAFGPLFDTREDAEAFLAHVAETDGRDPRLMTDGELATLRLDWLHWRNRVPSHPWDAFNVERARGVS